jgi:hypothetical protein
MMTFSEALHECQLFCDRITKTPNMEAIKVLCEAGNLWVELADDLDDDEVDIHERALEILEEDLGLIDLDSPGRPARLMITCRE